MKASRHCIAFIARKKKNSLQRILTQATRNQTVVKKKVFLSFEEVKRKSLRKETEKRKKFSMFSNFLQFLEK